MIAPMTKYSFILLSGEEKALLEQLQEIGLVDISRSTKPVDEHSREIVSEIEFLDGILKGLQTVEIPVGTAAKAIEGDIVRIAGVLIS